MKSIIRILSLFFSLYAFLVFLATLLIIVPGYFLIFNLCDKRKAPHVAHALSQVWAKTLLVLFFVRGKVKGKELIDQSQTYVFMANHRSMLDIPLFAVACKNTFRFLSKAELAKIPLMGYVIKKLYITVLRSDKNARSKSMDAMKSSIDEGISVFLCPEGTRNKTQKPLLDFHDGAFRLAVKTQKPIAVLTVTDTDKLLSPKGMIVLKPGFIHAHWSKPVITTGMTEEDIPQLKETCRQLMLKILEGTV